MSPEELVTFRDKEKERQTRYPYDSEAQRRSWLKSVYDMTPGEWDDLFEAQNGSCAICGEVGKKLQIDHDHDCCPATLRRYCGGCNRGLICFNCNTLLGLSKENPKTLLAAVHYLEQYSHGD